MVNPGSHFRRRVTTYLVIAVFGIVLAGGGFAAFESRQVSNYWEGVWWALSLMSTVGFVGAAPESVMGQLVSSVLMVTGFALMALVTAAIASLFVREEQEPEDQAEGAFEAQALELLTDLSRRLDAIESAIARETDTDPGTPRSS